MRQRKPLKIQACTLIAALLAAFVTGAFIPTFAHQQMLANARDEILLNSEQLVRLRAEIDEVHIEILRVRQIIKSAGNSSSSLTPNYTSIDEVIDDPPSDAAASSIYYELAYGVLNFFLLLIVFFDIADFLNFEI